MGQLDMTMIVAMLRRIESFPAHVEFGACRTSERRRNITMLQPANECDLVLKMTQIVS